MGVFNLHLSVFASLIAVAFGVWLFQIAEKARRIKCRHGIVWRSMSLCLMCVSWMPTANCAWVADARLQDEREKQQVAQPEVSKSTSIAVAEQPAWTLETDAGNIVSVNEDGSYAVRTRTGRLESGDRSAGWSSGGRGYGDGSGGPGLGSAGTGAGGGSF